MPAFKQLGDHMRAKKASRPGDEHPQILFPSFFNSSTSRFTSHRSIGNKGGGRPAAIDSYTCRIKVHNPWYVPGPPLIFPHRNFQAERRNNFASSIAL